ncbi:MAG TPA: hypothetical protein VLD35_20020, partial [Caldimonas sp.]|nr:hypothetical protein [Caldimonas sp.]
MRQDLLLSRRRLLAFAGSSMVAASLAACGGGGDAGAGDVAGGAGDPGAGDGGGGGNPTFTGDGAPTAGTPGTPVSAAERVATLDAVAREVTALAAGGVRFDSDALAARLQAMPALQRVGVSARMQNVWALFTDGRALVVPNNLDPAAGTTALQSSPDRRARALGGAPTERKMRALGTSIDLPSLLVDPQYRQLDMLGRVPSSAAVDAAHLCRDFVDGQTLPTLRLMARARGFALPESQRVQPPDAGYDNGIDGLRSVGGDGVFFITACAAEVGSAASPATVIATDTPATAQNEARYAADLAAGTLAYAVTMRGVNGAWVTYSSLAITPAFALGNRWRFPDTCIGILNLSGGSVLADWGSVLSECGLRNIFTWDKPVSWRRMLAFADDLLQMELGTNNLDGTAVHLDKEPRVRAYGVGATTGFLVNRGLANDGAGRPQAYFLQESAAPLIVSVLVPTIDYVNIDETRDLIELNGQFGRTSSGPAGGPDPEFPDMPTQSEVRLGSALGRFGLPQLSRASDPLVSAGYASIPVGSRGDLIQATLPGGALDRGGYVQVVNGGRWSNAVQVTHWEIPVRVERAITGGLVLLVEITLRLRADVRGYRLQPDGKRLNGAAMVPLSCSARSSARYQASGEISRTVLRETTTITWSGSGVVENPPGGQLNVTAGGLLMWPER